MSFLRRLIMSEDEGNLTSEMIDAAIESLMTNPYPEPVRDPILDGMIHRVSCMEQNCLTCLRYKKIREAHKKFVQELLNDLH